MDEICDILGYICQKATSRYGGRNWTVWFAPEIMVSEDPWKLRGLPKLTLNTDDKDAHYAFECIALQRLEQKMPIIISIELSN
jgi:GLPGLI family protein